MYKYYKLVTRMSMDRTICSEIHPELHILLLAVRASDVDRCKLTRSLRSLTGTLHFRFIIAYTICGTVLTGI